MLWFINEIVIFYVSNHSIISIECTYYFHVLCTTKYFWKHSLNRSLVFFLPKALCHSPLVSSTASVLFSILLNDCLLAALTLLPQSSESGDVWKISWNLKIVATSVDTSNKNFQNSQNHIVVVFSGSHNIEISADFSDVSWFTEVDFRAKKCQMLL